MGIESAFRNELVERHRRCKHTTEPSLAGFVVIHDLLTALFRAIGPNHNYLYSGAELYTQIMRPVRKAFKDGVDVYVMVCDDSKNVPKQKAATQAARSDASAIKPYPKDKDYRITINGMLILDKAPAAGAAVSGEACMIDMQRLVRTRALRLQMMKFVAELASSQEPIPAGKSLIIDFDSSCPPVIVRGADSQLPPQALVQHVLGEADLGLMYWATVFKQSPKLFDTIDTDFMPLFAWWKSQHTDSKARCLWKYEKDGCVDARMLIRDTLAELNMTAQTFVVFCILTGTDFYDKSITTFKFGHKKLLAPFQRSHDLWATLWEQAEGKPHDNMRCLHKFLFALYGPYIKGAMGQWMIDDAEDGGRTFNWTKFRIELITDSKLPKSYRPPTEAQVKLALSRLEFNFRYWAIKDGIAPPPEPEGEEGREDPEGEEGREDEQQPGSRGVKRSVRDEGEEEEQSGAAANSRVEKRSIAEEGEDEERAAAAAVGEKEGEEDDKEEQDPPRHDRPMFGDLRPAMKHIARPGLRIGVHETIPMHKRQHFQLKPSC